MMGIRGKQGPDRGTGTANAGSDGRNHGQRSKSSGADHSVMRELNRSLVLDLLKQSGPLSRAAIAKTAELAKPTVSVIVDELIGEDLVREIGTGRPTQGGGRPPILLEFNARSRFLVGVHLGVRRTTACVADAMGTEIGRVQRVTPHGRPREALRKAAELVRKALAQTGAPAERLGAVGVCVPGLVELESGMCRLAPNLGWRDVPVRDVLEEELGVAIYVHNAAQASAVSETVEGAAQEATDVTLLYAGSGVGAGVLTDGRLYHGSLGIAGEIGHCRVPGASEPCNCGKVGCLETVASAQAVARDGARAAAGTSSPLAVAARMGEVDAAAVAVAAANGDEVAKRVLAEAGEQLGIAASWLVNLFNPQILVIGGGLAGAGESFLGPLRQATTEHALPQAVEDLRIVPSALGQDAEVRGAVLVARQSADTYYRVVFQG